MTRGCPKTYVIQTTVNVVCDPESVDGLGVLSSAQEFQWCFKEVSRVFQGSLRDISRVFKKVLRVFQLGLRGVPSSFKGAQGYLKEV